ncbi:hypothetical protein [Paraliomyxa miuraensis]|uniref:hypothetical protein n=1 Tax=Paraliomyxa miuraensis TaxID=376150 RepID=UPI002255ECC3|nr:hypothetical protein [Paraliomyxa miuraensis]MCX4239740.1 hypothetical protein [Paraliomyxa miuraensis]
MSEPTRAAIEAEGPVEVEAEEGWLVEIERQLTALGRDVLGREPSGRTLAKLREELEILACVVAWYHEQGSITGAAARRGTNRRILRARVKVWAQRHPQHVPDQSQRPQRLPLSEEEEAKRAQAREKNNARRRARRAKLRAEESAHAARGGVEATAAKAAGRS